MRFRLACAAAAIAICASVPIAQEGAPAPPPTAIVVGRVLDGPTERPVPNVLVALSAPTVVGLAPAPPAGRGAPALPRVLTDSAGRFVFTAVPPGRYSLQVSSTGGPLTGGYGMRRPGGSTQSLEVAASARIADVTVRIWRPASISGTLTDQSGEPVSETRVTALRASIVGGMRRFVVSRTTITDDRGEFRLSRLEPGEYTIYLPFSEVTIPATVQAAYDTVSQGGNAAREQFRVQTGESGAPNIADGFRIGGHILVRGSSMYGADGAIGPMLTTPSPDDAGNVLVYPFTYYPGVTSLSEAGTFTLESGQERTGTDMQVRLVPSARVSGQVVGPEGAVAMVGVRLIAASAAEAADDTVVEAGSTITDANGAFTFLGIPSGQYTLKVSRLPVASQVSSTTTVTVGGVTTFSSIPESQLPPPKLPVGPTLGASMPLTVADREVSNVHVALRAGPRVTGRIEYDGSSSPLTTDQLLRAVITLEPIDGRTLLFGSGRGQFDEAGRFTTIGLLPGRYVLRLSGNLGPWSLESAMAGAQDISDAPITIDTDNVAGVVLKITDHQASLAGSVRAQAGPDPNAIVLVFPADRAAWMTSGITLRRLRSSRVSPQGTYQVSNLPAGDYFVIAIDDKAAANWQDAKRLEVLSHTATRITIQPGVKHATDLMTETIR
jgi:protocatechuate 3,4-dioxygenase beta subunit